MPLLLALLLVILVEISLFVIVGGVIGLLPTLAVVLGTGVLGGMILRAQGQKTLARMVDTVREPRSPLAATAGDGVLVALAGILLILPGLLTDAVGLILLVPQVRAAILRRFADHACRHPGAVVMHVVAGSRPHATTAFDAMAEGEILEGEVLDPPSDSTHPGRQRR